MASLTATTVRVDRLGREARDAAWAIFDRYYEDADRERFERDLDAKDHVILVHDGPTLVGFSTVRVDRLRCGEREVVSVFSGDTVIEASHHGHRALQWAFFRYLATTKLMNPHRLVVWFLISKGYKTYLLLARNFTTWWPRRDHPTPAWAGELIATLARRSFGDAFDPAAGLLRFDRDHERLRGHVAPTAGQDDPDIRFFEARNPGHALGDELVCVGVVDASLIASFPLRLLRAAARARTRPARSR